MIRKTNEAGIIKGLGVKDFFVNKESLNDELFEACKVLNFVICPSGALFKRDQEGFMPVLMKEMFDKRTKYKKEMLSIQQQLEENKNEDDDKKLASLKAKQMAIKILMNSLYGSMCSPYFRFFSIDLAMSITLSGQLTIRWIESKLNEYMNKLLKTSSKDYVIAVDTDSNYINCGPLVEKFIQGDRKKDDNSITEFLNIWAEKNVQKVIDSAFNELANKMNAYDPCLKMKRESIARKGLWTGKKRYVVHVLDQEGVRFEKPKMKFTGIEVVRSSVPEVCRNALKETLDIIMTKNEDELIKYVDDFRIKHSKMSFYEVSFPRGVNGITTYYDPSILFKSKCPIHVRGAIVYNEFIKNNKLEKKYPYIKDGDNIKFCYLKIPNRLKSDVVSCLSKIPDEMNIGSLIDYRKQFNTTFEEPLNSILSVIGWKMQRELTLENAFE